MADLRKTKEDWERVLGRELGTLLALLRELQEVEDKYSKQRIQVVVLNDPLGNVGPRGIVLAGVDLGRNTAVDGVLFVRVVGQADPRTVRLYRAAGAAAAALMAEGAGNSGTLVQLAARNASGLTGAWDLPAAVKEDLSDRLRLFPVPDWAVRVAKVWDGTAEKDVRAQDEALAALRAVAARLSDARAIVRELLATWATRLGGRGAEFLGATSPGLVLDSPTRDGSGAVIRRRTGFLPTLARAMQDDSVAGVQSIVARVVKADAAVFSPANDGKGRVAAHVPREFCPAARWVFRCVRGKDTGHGGREEFECTAKVVGEDREITFSSVRVRQSFSGPEGIGPFTLERVATKTADPHDQNLAPADQAVATGERDGNTEGGILYWRIEKGPVAWDVSFYRSANRTLGELVAKAEGLAALAPFQANERTAAGLTVVWRLGPQPVDGVEGALDLNFFVVENAAGVPDEFEITTTVVDAGLYQHLLAEQVGGRLNSRPRGQETIPDGWVRAGTFVPFSVEDR